MRIFSPRNCVISGSLTICLGVGSAVSGVIGAHADDGNAGAGFQSYGLTAVAAGLKVLATTATGQAAGSADGGVPWSQATTSYGPSGRALSSIAWPGTLGGNLGSLLLVAGIPTVGVPPQIPLPVPPLPPPPAIPSQLDPYLPLLNDPVRAEANTGGGPSVVTNNTIPGVSMVATALPAKIQADTQVLGIANTVVGDTGPIHTTATTSLPDAAIGTAEAKSTISDFQVGPLHIGVVTSNALATTNGTKATVTGHTVVAEATVGGVPVTIDSSGVHVNGQGTSLKQLTDGVNTALKNAGMSVFVSQPVGKTTGSSAIYDAGSVVISLPQSVVVQLGGAFVSLSATLPGNYTISIPPVAANTGSAGSAGNPGTPGTIGTPGITSSVPSIANNGTTNPTLAPPLQSAALRLPGGLGWGWIALVLLGGGLLAAGLRRLPDQILATAGTTCSLGENT